MSQEMSDENILQVGAPKVSLLQALKILATSQKMIHCRMFLTGFDMQVQFIAVTVGKKLYHIFFVL